MAIIAGVERVEIAEQNGAVRPKAAVQMQGWPAKLLLNKVNFETIAGAYGRQSAGWLGKPLEVYPDTTLFGGRSVPCIRVRVPRPAATAGRDSWWRVACHFAGGTGGTGSAGHSRSDAAAADDDHRLRKRRALLTKRKRDRCVTALVPKS